MAATASPAESGTPAPADELAFLRQRVAELEAELEAREARHRRTEQVQVALYRIADQASSAKNLPDFYQAIHAILSELMYAHNFFIVLYDEGSGTVNFPFYVDEVDTEVFPTNEWFPVESGLGRGLTAYILRTGIPLLATPETFDALIASGEVEIVGANSVDWMGVPLQLEGHTLGALVMQSYDPSVRYKAEDLELLTYVSRHIAAALLSARRLGETRQRVVELAIMNSLTKTLATQLKLDAVIEFVGHQIGELFAAEALFIALCDETEQILRFPYFLENGERLDVSPQPLDQGLTGHVVKSRAPLLINHDYAEESKKYGARHTAGEMPKSWLGVPIIVRGAVRGVISLQHMQRENQFSEADQRMLTTMGASMWIAIENALLFESIEQRVAERTQELDRLYQMQAEARQTADILLEIGRVVSATLDRDEVLGLILGSLSTVLAYDGASVALLRDDALYLQAARGLLEPDLVNQRVLALGRYPLNREVIENGQSIVLADVLSEPRWKAGASEHERAVRAWIGAPLRTGGQIVGMLSVVSRTTHAYSEANLPLVTAFASQAANALQHAELFRVAQAARAEAEDANRLKTQFLANMSHELRTPLNSIINFAYLLTLGVEGPLTPGQEDLLQRIGEAGQHLLGLINDILDLAKIESGRLELFFEEVDLRELINGVLSTAVGLLRDKPVELLREIPENLPTVRADRTRVRQVLLNLLSNAAKFTEKGSIVVRAKSNAEWVTISVADSGIGMRTEDLPKAFAEFVQIDGSMTRQAGGTGLGLPISRRFVEMHGGRMWAESTPGVGSTFSFTLPRTTQTPSAELPEPAEVENEPETVRVLVIDDDPTAREVITRQLTHGYEVHKLSDSRRVLETVRETHPQVIVLDVLMPHRDGWDLLEQLKSDPETRDIPIIMSSVLHEQKLAQSLGADEYLVKPVRYEDLRRAIGHLVPPGGKVLAVDDDPNALEILSQMLDGLRYQVTTAQEGAEGLARVESEHPDVIVLDLMMPGMNGFEILGRLRANAATAKLPVIIVTAKDLSNAERTHLQAEAATLLQKGHFSPEEFINAIRRAWQQRAPEE